MDRKLTRVFESHLETFCDLKFDDVRALRMSRPTPDTEFIKWNWWKHKNKDGSEYWIKTITDASLTEAAVFGYGGGFALTFYNNTGLPAELAVETIIHPIIKGFFKETWGIR